MCSLRRFYLFCAFVFWHIEHRSFNARCAVHTRILQRARRRALSVMIYFAINKSRCSARFRDLIAFSFYLFIPSDIKIQDSLHRSIVSRSSFALAFGFSSFSSLLTINTSYTLATFSDIFYRAIFSRYSRNRGKKCSEKCVSSCYAHGA